MGAGGGGGGGGGGLGGGSIRMGEGHIFSWETFFVGCLH